MDLYEKIYTFAASAGAFEGYVYPREKLDTSTFADWIDNLVKQYNAIPVDVRNKFQASLDRTLGRALLSVVPVLGKDHELTVKLRSLIKGEIPKSLDDFDKEKAQKKRM